MGVARAAQVILPNVFLASFIYFLAFLTSFLAAFFGAAFLVAVFLTAAFFGATFFGATAFFGAAFLAATFFGAAFFGAAFGLVTLAAFGLVTFGAAFSFLATLTGPDGPFGCKKSPVSTPFSRRCWRESQS